MQSPNTTTQPTNFWIRNAHTFENGKRAAAIIVTAIAAIALIGSILLFLATQGYHLGRFNSLALSFGTQGVDLAMVASGVFFVCSVVMSGIILRNSFQKPSSTEEIKLKTKKSKKKIDEETQKIIEKFRTENFIPHILKNKGDYWIERDLSNKDVVFYRDPNNIITFKPFDLGKLDESELKKDFGVFNRNAKEEFENSKEYPEELGMPLMLGAGYPYKEVEEQITETNTYWPETNFKTKSEVYPTISFVIVKHPLMYKTRYFKKTDYLNDYIKSLGTDYTLAEVKKT